MTRPSWGALPIQLPTHLVVLYDDRCELCRRCRAWLERSAQLVPLSFVAADDHERVQQLRLDPGLVPVGDELVVVADTGAVWVGPDAFITCLWALAEHRAMAGRLQRPTLRPLAKAAFHALSATRGSISPILRQGATSGGLPQAAMTDPSCGDDACRPMIGNDG